MNADRKAIVVIRNGILIGGICWMISTIFVMVGYTFHGLIGDVAYKTVYSAAIWPVWIWHHFDPIVRYESAFYVAIGRNLIGWILAAMPLGNVDDLERELAFVGFVLC
jgi:hypothetical protein